MTSSYFTPSDFEAFHPTSIVHDKMVALHESLHRRLHDHHWDLYPNWERANLVCNRSAAASGDIHGMTLAYHRSQEQAQVVERLTGREGAGSLIKVDSQRHPTVELRITPTHFTLELVLSPSSWWDQRNLIGKLSVARHREAMRALVQKMNGDYCFGFWEGTHLSDMHLTHRQILRGTILDEWMGTFGDGQDWLRIGAWYAIDDPALTGDNIVREIIGRMGALYPLYAFALWTSNNNFQSFYKGAHIPTPSRSRANRL